MRYFIAFFLFIICNESFSFEYELVRNESGSGLHKKIYSIDIIDNNLVAGTEQGLYASSLSETLTWSLREFQDNKVTMVRCIKNQLLVGSVNLGMWPTYYEYSTLWRLKSNFKKLASFEEEFGSESYVFLKDIMSYNDLLFITMYGTSDWEGGYIYSMEYDFSNPNMIRDGSDYPITYYDFFDILDHQDKILFSAKPYPDIDGNSEDGSVLNYLDGVWSGLLSVDYTVVSLESVGKYVFVVGMDNDSKTPIVFRGEYQITGDKYFWTELEIDANHSSLTHVKKFNNEIFVFNSEGDIYIFDSSSLSFHQYDSVIVPKQINDSVLDSLNNRLYLATDDGVYCLQIKQETVEEADISGYLSVCKNGNIIEDFKITLTNLKIPTKQYSDNFSNPKGQFEFEGIVKGNYNILLESDGYVDLDTTISVFENLSNLTYCMSEDSSKKYIYKVHTMSYCDSMDIENVEIKLINDYLQPSPTSFTDAEGLCQFSLPYLLDEFTFECQHKDFYTKEVIESYFEETSQISLVPSTFEYQCMVTLKNVKTKYYINDTIYVDIESEIDCNGEIFNQVTYNIRDLYCFTHDFEEYRENNLPQYGLLSNVEDKDQIGFIVLLDDDSISYVTLYSRAFIDNISFLKTDSVEVNTIQPFNLSIKSTDNITISPNPASNYINIQLDEQIEKITSLRIINQLGQVMVELNDLQSTGTEVLPMVDFNLIPGVYYLHVTSGNRNFNSHFVVR